MGFMTITDKCTKYDSADSVYFLCTSNLFTKLHQHPELRSRTFSGDAYSLHVSPSAIGSFLGQGCPLSDPQLPLASLRWLVRSLHKQVSLLEQINALLKVYMG